jgi:phytoene/squalene synthetase
MNDTASLAQSITGGASKQTYYTIKFMVDKDLVDHAYRAYAYFRWVDDVVDIHAASKAERSEFIQRQKSLIGGLSAGKRFAALRDEERLALDVLQECADPQGDLKSYFEKTIAVIEFDARRRGRFISGRELSWYSTMLAEGVMHAVHHFIGHRCRYPLTPDRTHAALGAHVAHMLRDAHEDVEDGIFNIPWEYLEKHRIEPTDFDSMAYRQWVEEQVRLSWAYMASGKRYLQAVENLRCRIVGHWYSARFVNVLRAIEKDHHLLRREYPEQKNRSAWLRMAWIGFWVPLKHLLSNLQTS